MASYTATRLALRELRVKQESLYSAVIFSYWGPYVSIDPLRQEVQALRETCVRLEQAEREEAPEQLGRETVEQAEQAEREQLEHERIARLWRSLEYLVLLLLSILRFLLGCSKFGGFQNRERPRCTTMPWNIWPSLVVLWGVCWMFVNTPFIEFDATQFNSAFDDEQLPLFVPSKTFPSTREIFQMH
jgi:hypothetical protein